MPTSSSSSGASSSSSPSNLLRWLRLKRYQYEVTFSLYMLTPIEKFIFNSFLFLFLSMIIIAASLYLPHHINFLANRAWFYYAGDDAAATAASSAAAAAAAAAAGVAGGVTTTATTGWDKVVVPTREAMGAGAGGMDEL
ncbi:MAG: hypothetical protein M1837_002124 [Sclerophora amabilis]|nr:MAG: hypothetical protein M1837_002124 [Sclerophora amabilis]